MAYTKIKEAKEFWLDIIVGKRVLCSQLVVRRQHLVETVSNIELSFHFTQELTEHPCFNTCVCALWTCLTSLMYLTVPFLHRLSQFSFSLATLFWYWGIFYSLRPFILPSTNSSLPVEIHVSFDSAKTDKTITQINCMLEVSDTSILPLALQIHLRASNQDVATMVYKLCWCNNKYKCASPG